MSPTSCDQSIDSGSLLNVSSLSDVYNEDHPSMYSRPYRTFRSNEEYLWAMKEDLAEWLNNLYEINVNADNFIDKLETGVVLCRHANNVISKARQCGHKFDNNKYSNIIYKSGELVYRSTAKPKTFQARDNVSNFIAWCKSLAIHECLLFETDDLVLGKNEKSFILCLLEVSRKCTQFGIAAPLIVQMEQEIDRELDEERYRESQSINNNNTINNNSLSVSSSTLSSLSSSSSSTLSNNKQDDNNNQSTLDKSVKTETVKYESQIITNNLKCLHERVVDLLNRCTCPSQFPMIKVADGKYRVGNTKVLIYVRILRNHVMVRVGGGWDTLGHYLDRHDPCRCRTGLRSTMNSKVSLFSRNSTSGPKIWVNYNRPYPPEPQYTSFDNLRCDSSSLLYPNLKRRDSIGLTESSCSLNSFSEGSDRQPSRSSHYSDDSSSSSITGPGSPRNSISCSVNGLNLSPCDGQISPTLNHLICPRDNLKTTIRLRSTVKTTKSGIASYVGLPTYQRPISTKVGSCTNLRYCHQPVIKPVRRKT